MLSFDLNEKFAPVNRHVQFLEQLTGPDIEQGNIPWATLLQDSVYYPCSAYDYNIIPLFRHHFQSYVYCSYMVRQKDFLQRLEVPGYQVNGMQFTSRCMNDGWEVLLPEGQRSRERYEWARQFQRNRAFIAWVVFEKEPDNNFPETAPSHISLIYLGNEEAMAMYQYLYWRYQILPMMVVILNPGHNEGGNWCTFSNYKSPFMNTLMMHPLGMPEYVFNGGHRGNFTDITWPRYKFCGEFSLGVCQEDDDYDDRYASLHHLSK